MEEVNKKLNELYEKISEQSGINKILTFKVETAEDFKIALALTMLLTESGEPFDNKVIKKICKENNCYYDEEIMVGTFENQLNLLSKSLAKKEKEVLLMVLIVLIKEVERM